MTIEVHPFDPVLATDADFDAYHRVLSDAQPVDKPHVPSITREAVIGGLRRPNPEFGPVRHWLARAGGEVVGVAFACLPEHENAHLVLVDLTVHPDHRRRGVGTAVLDAVREDVRDGHRTVIEGFQLPKGGVGEKWATALGFRVTHATVMQTLVVAEVDRARWDFAAPAGYRLVHWTGATPADLVDSYARARRAIHDAPLGDTSYQPRAWTVEQVRADEAQLREQGVEQRVAVAVHEGTGEVAGMTELHVAPHRPTWGNQRDTAVRAEHRGRGLGVAVKTHLYRRLLADRPDFERIHTGTGAPNTHMIRVNEALGFTTVRELVNVSRVLDPAPPAPRR
ncbi:GNAT family N-acetyltransferase [Saccharothrix luteola]|uniref:GNAT family N-acetyltransferase n=1 Tax=Saccharothrix luteola TaxID=2893018 RepID=UPI001E2F9F26|nr:GNAT family N-acetyltransferase [Saccharothrix luteola]MCC8248249.1 GNAT family N-acetyltransferase [Saccharothrix luteola]